MLLAQQWEESGINTAFVSTGLVANDTFRQALRKHHIPVYIIFPVFQNPEFLRHDSSLFAITGKGEKAKYDWVQFVCPSRARYRNSKIIWTCSSPMPFRGIGPRSKNLGLGSS